MTSEVFRLFRIFTHTPCLWQGGVQCPGTGGENEDGKGDDDEMKAKMRWKIT